MLNIVYYLMVPCAVLFDVVPERYGRIGLLERSARKSPMLESFVLFLYIIAPVVAAAIAIYFLFFT